MHTPIPVANLYQHNLDSIQKRTKAAGKAGSPWIYSPSLSHLDGGNPPYLPLVCCDRPAPLLCCPPSLSPVPCSPPQNALLSNLRTVIASLTLPLSLYPSLSLSLSFSLVHTEIKQWLVCRKPGYFRPNHPQPEKIDSAIHLSLFSYILYIYTLSNSSYHLHWLKWRNVVKESPRAKVF